MTDIYINDKNELHAILDIPSMAGAGHYYADLPIDLGASKGRNLTVTESFITAELRDGKLSLTFTQNEDSELVFGAIKNPPEYGKTYPVDGICDDYQQMLIGYLGNNINPYLFLLTLDGRVEVVNITSGMQYGYYCSTGTSAKDGEKDRARHGYGFRGRRRLPNRLRIEQQRQEERSRILCFRDAERGAPVDDRAGLAHEGHAQNGRRQLYR